MPDSKATTRTCSIWTAPPNARFEPLELLSRAVLTPEQIKAARESASESIRERQKAYETPLSSHTMRILLP